MQRLTDKEQVLVKSLLKERSSELWERGFMGADLHYTTRDKLTDASHEIDLILEKLNDHTHAPFGSHPS